MALISSRFDFNQGMSAYQSVDMWKQTLGEIISLFEILEQHPEICVDGNAEEPDESDEEGDEPAVESLQIRGSIVSFVSRLDDEFTKSLQNTDPHMMEYIERLKDEVVLYSLIRRADDYHQNLADDQSLTILRTLRLEHIYHKVCCLHFISTVDLVVNRAMKSFNCWKKAVDGYTMLALHRQMPVVRFTICASTCISTRQIACVRAPCLPTSTTMP